MQQKAFDHFVCRVLILQRGRVVYFGDNGDAATAYFMQTLPEVGLIPPRRAAVPLLAFAVSYTTTLPRT